MLHLRTQRASIGETSSSDGGGVSLLTILGAIGGGLLGLTFGIPIAVGGAIAGMLAGGAIASSSSSSSSSVSESGGGDGRFAPSGFRIDPSLILDLHNGVGSVSPEGLTPEQKAAIDELGRKAQAEFEAEKKKFVDNAEKAGSALGGEEGGAFMRALGKIATSLMGGPDKWFTDEQFQRANNAIVDMMKCGLRPIPYDNSLHAGYEGYADVLETELARFHAMPDSQQARWQRFALWMYDHPGVANAAGFPWDTFSFFRNDTTLAAFGRAYAQSLNAPALADQYAGQAVRIGQWLRVTMPYRSTDGTYKGLGILLDNIDHPTF